MLAVYRGVPYNTDRQLTQSTEYRKVTLVYRGIEYVTTIRVGAGQ